jgi:hypothetical protein
MRQLRVLSKNGWDLSRDQTLRILLAVGGLDDGILTEIQHVSDMAFSYSTSTKYIILSSSESQSP